jgi:hypothetical protein
MCTRPNQEGVSEAVTDQQERRQPHKIAALIRQHPYPVIEVGVLPAAPQRSGCRRRSLCPLLGRPEPGENVTHTQQRLPFAAPDDCAVASSLTPFDHR